MKCYRVVKSKHYPNGTANIYTKKEALEQGIEFVCFDNWRSVREGEYAETVDGFITSIIKRTDGHHSTAHIKTPTGCFHLNRKGTIFDTLEFHNRNSFSRQPRWRGKNKLTPQQTKCLELYFGKCEFNLDLSIQLAYPTLSAMSREVLGKYIISSPHFSKMAKEKLPEIAEKYNLDVDLIVARIAEATRDLKPTSQNFLGTMKLAARVLGESGLEEPLAVKPKELSPKGALFDNNRIEEAEYDDVDKSKMKIISGPVKKKVSA